MRRMILPLMLAATAACRPAATGLTEERKAEIAAEVGQTARELWATVEGLDFERWIDLWVSQDALYYQGGPMLFVNQLDILPTRDAIAAAFEPAFRTLSSKALDVQNESFAVLGENLALHVFKANYTNTDTLGAVTGPAPVTASVVWVREGAEWRVLHAHQSFNPGG